MRKLIATITMVSVVLLTALSPAFAQSEASTLLESIESIEMHLYGEYLPGAIVDRLEQIERDVFGQVESGSVVDRINRIRQAAGRLLRHEGLRCIQACGC